MNWIYVIKLNALLGKKHMFLHSLESMGIVPYNSKTDLAPSLVGEPKVPY